MAFKLPRLKSNLSIVNPKGHPIDYFLRFWNMDVAPRIEAQVADLTEITNELAYQLGLIQDAMDASNAAQLAADEAQTAAAEALSLSSGQARYASMSGMATISKSVTVTDVPANVSITWSGSLDGGSLTLDEAWVGEAILEENDGVSSVIVASAPISVPSTGTLNPDTSYGAGGASASLRGFGTLTGTVTYNISFVRTSGAEFFATPNLDSIITLIPEAT